MKKIVVVGASSDKNCHPGQCRPVLQDGIVLFWKKEESVGQVNPPHHGPWCWTLSSDNLRLLQIVLLGIIIIIITCLQFDYFLNLDIENHPIFFQAKSVFIRSFGIKQSINYGCVVSSHV